MIHGECRAKAGRRVFLAAAASSIALASGAACAQTAPATPDVSRMPSPASPASSATPATSAGVVNAASGAASGDQAATDIVVTARRRAEPLSKVPLSIVATDQKALDDRGVKSFSDLARLTPSVTFGQSALAYGTGQSNIAIRGVTTVSGVPTTGIYIDDTPVQTRNGGSPSLTNPYPQIFDLDRVEVLRGPQGTLFGTGSMGGAVRFITPEPSYNDLSIYARSEVSTTDHGGVSYEAGGAVGIPVVEDKLGIRVSVWHRHDSGYIDRLDRVTKQLVKQDINYQNSTNARFALGWKPTEFLTITPSVYYQKTYYGDADLYELATSRGSNLSTSISRLPQTHSDEFVLPALKVSVDLGGVTLISNSSYFSRKTRTVSDDSTLSLALFSGYNYTVPAALNGYLAYTKNRTSQTTFTQEVRLQSADPNARFTWVLGAFYGQGSTKDNYGGADPDLLDNINFGLSQAGEPPVGSVADVLGYPLYQGQYSNLVMTRYKDTQKSAFFQADFKILPELKLTAGVRYTSAGLTYDSFYAGPVYGTDTGLTARATPHNNQVTPKFGVSYQANSANLFYANVAKGARAGLVAPAVGSFCGADAANLGFDPLVARPIKPDSLWSYEVGTKNRLFGGRVTTDISAYHIDWSNIQSTLFLPICSLPTTFNLGKAKIDGFDMAISVKPAKGLTLGASVSYTNARYSQSQPNGYNKGEPLGVAPWSVHLEGEYEFELAARDYYLRSDFSYTSHDGRPLDLTSPLVDPNLPRPPSASLLNLRAGARFSGFDLSVFAANVTNSEPVLSRGHDTVRSQVFRSTTYRPRTIGLTLTYRH